MFTEILCNGAEACAAAADRLDLCHALPATYTEARGRCTLGHGPASATERETATGVVVAVSFKRGTFEAKGRIAYWALTGGGKLWAAGKLPSSTEVYPDHAYDPGQFTITLPGV